MRVLVIGGSGHVGSLVLPHLKQEHTLRVYDLRPPADTTLDFVEGNSSDYNTLLPAMKDCDTLLYMAMGNQGWQDIEAVTTNFDANVKGLYVALKAAHDSGITHAVYTSSMSVYEGNLMRRYFPDEDMPVDAAHFYGLSKRLGEECCRAAVHSWGLSVNALRLCLPVSEERWLAETHKGTPTIATTATDVARALSAAIGYRDKGFTPIMISGDYEETCMKMTRAKNLLNWTPLARPVL